MGTSERKDILKGFQKESKHKKKILKTKVSEKFVKIHSIKTEFQKDTTKEP